MEKKTDIVNNSQQRWYCWPEDVHIRIASINIVKADAIGNFVVSLSELFRHNNINCSLYAQGTDDSLKDSVKSISDLQHDVRETDLLFFNFSIFDANIDMIAALPCKKIMYYHNITPPEMLREYCPELAEYCTNGYRQLNSAAGGFDTYITNSQMTKKELLTALPEDTQRNENNIFVCPPMISVDKWEHISSEPLKLPDARELLLYVGRIAPHKKVKDLIFLYNEYHKLNPDSALLIAGGIGSMEYYDHITSLIDEKFTHIKDRIHILNNITDSQLKHLYKESSVFVTMSEHEGFCVPLVEAMYFKKPVFAYAQEAVRETLGTGGMIFYEKDFPSIAIDIDRVLQDKNLYKKIIASQTKKLYGLSAQTDGSTIWQAIERTLFNAGTL